MCRRLVAEVPEKQVVGHSYWQQLLRCFFSLFYRFILSRKKPIKNKHNCSVYFLVYMIPLFMIIFILSRMNNPGAYTSQQPYVLVLVNAQSPNLDTIDTGSNSYCGPFFGLLSIFISFFQTA